MKRLILNFAFLVRGCPVVTDSSESRAINETFGAGSGKTF